MSGSDGVARTPHPNPLPQGEREQSPKVELAERGPTTSDVLLRILYDHNNIDVGVYGIVGGERKRK